MHKSKTIAAGVITLAAALALAACGQQSPKNSSQQAVTISTTAPLDTIDISKSSGYGQTGNVFESFYRLGKNGKPAAGLAKSSQVSKDGKTWTFHLRKADWSNGDPIRAQDFVYSWQRSLNPKTASPYAYLFNGVKNANKVQTGKLPGKDLGIKALDQHTVQVKLDKPIGYFKVLMAYPLFGPQNEKVIKKYGHNFATKAQYQVYSGPFKIVGWTAPMTLGPLLKTTTTGTKARLS